MNGFLKQAGAIPFRVEADGLRVLLMTSLETGRWVIPKGGIEPGESAWRAAEREALEEAGVKGIIHKTAIGSYTYGKRLRSGGIRPTIVEVFTLEVRKQLKKWPERGQRRLEWVTIPVAADLVEETGMVALLRRLGEKEVA
jgi:8-oxo-dGTP pyrophosphatase MutT (NUDIX family)